MWIVSADPQLPSLSYSLCISVIERSHLLGALECKQDLAANQVRVIQRFELGCHAPPLIVSEVVVLNAGSVDVRATGITAYLKEQRQVGSGAADR